MFLHGKRHSFNGRNDKNKLYFLLLCCSFYAKILSPWQLILLSPTKMDMTQKETERTSRNVYRNLAQFPKVDTKCTYVISSISPTASLLSRGHFSSKIGSRLISLTSVPTIPPASGTKDTSVTLWPLSRRAFHRTKWSITLINFKLWWILLLE